ERSEAQRGGRLDARVTVNRALLGLATLNAQHQPTRANRAGAHYSGAADGFRGRVRLTEALMKARLQMTRRSMLSVMIVPLLVIACGGHAQAVEVDSGGAGEALIVPVWSTGNGNNTLLSLAGGDQYEGQDEPLAVKLRVRDQQGEIRFSANIYLTSGNHVWAAAILAAEGGGSRISTSSEDCVLIEEQDQVVVMDGPKPIAADVGL